MKRNILIITAFILFTTISCSSEQKESKQTQNERQNAVQTINTQKITPDSSLAVQPDANDNVELNDEIIAPTIARSETAPRISNAPILNPPHGQPGHRCEIPVGSPLNSTPSTNKPKANVSSPAPSVNNNATSPVVTSETPALNPPHGQPNHRCDIPVGSPLNSTPSAKTPKVNAPSPAPRVNANATSPVVTSETPVLNPPHGQPGHRCEIPVGSPLK